MMVSRKTFLFVAGATALDFLNTEVMADGQPADLLESFDDLADWLGEAGLADRAAASGLRALPPGRGRRLLAEAKELRRQLRTTAARLAEGFLLRRSDLDPVDAVLHRATGTLALTLEKRAVLAFAPAASARFDPLFLLALAAAEFLASADPSLVRSCEGRGCILFFYDTTKSHTRRWCSMASCGNRMKVSAHYQRSKEPA